jgi:hypothetical protein
MRTFEFCRCGHLDRHHYATGDCFTNGCRCVEYSGTGKYEPVPQPSSQEKCLTEGCGGDAKVRGICRSCYWFALREVRNGRSTWEAFESSGKAKPARQRGTPSVFPGRAAWFRNANSKSAEPTKTNNRT